MQLLSKPPYGPPLYWHQVRAAQQLAYTAFLLHTSWHTWLSCWRQQAELSTPPIARRADGPLLTPGAGGAAQDWMGWNSPLSTTPWPQVVFFSYYLTDTTAENGCLRVAPRPGSRGMRGVATRPPAWGLPTLHGAPDGYLECV